MDTRSTISQMNFTNRIFDTRPTFDGFFNFANGLFGYSAYFINGYFNLVNGLIGTRPTLFRAILISKMDFFATRPTLGKRTFWSSTGSAIFRSSHPRVQASGDSSVFP